MRLSFVTTNPQKFAKGYSVCQEYGIELVQLQLEIDEVQSEDTDYVALKKAEAAFASVNEPVVISDDAWQMLGLSGFPGTYAKSVNKWLKPEDYLRLMAGVSDRRADFIQTLVYQDAGQQKLFKHTAHGKVTTEVRGDSGVSIQAVISLEPDGQTSIAEVIGSGSYYDGPAALEVWHDFAKWYAKRKQ